MGPSMATVLGPRTAEFRRARGPIRAEMLSNLLTLEDFFVTMKIIAFKNP